MRSMVTVLMVLVLAVSAQAANLISNGSFDQGADPYGLDGWSASGTINLANAAAADSVWVYPAFWGGTYSNVMVIRSSGAGGNGEGVMQYFAIGDAPAYTLSYQYGFTNIGSYSTVSLSYRDANGDVIPGAGWFQQAFDWTDKWGNEDHNPNDVAYNNSSPGLVTKEIALTRGAATAGNSLIIPDAARYATITLRQHYAGYQTYFDNVSLEAIPEPVSMMLLAGGAVMALRRRK